MSGVKRTGGVSFGGDRRAGGSPSAAGAWAQQWDGQTVDFDRDAFTRFVADKGYDIAWQKAALCPNTPRTGLSQRDHDFSCRVCDGSGFVYFDEVKTRMLIQGVKLDQSYYAYGRWDVGQVMVTAEPEFTINYWDRLVLGNGTIRFTERLARNVGTTLDRLKYPALCMEYLAWVDRTGALKTYKVDRDFQLSADCSSIEWLTTSRPDDLDRYTVAYRCRPRYTVLDLVHHHRDSTIGGDHFQFPVQAVAKLDFLVRDQSKTDAPQTVDQSPFPD